MSWRGTLGVLEVGGWSSRRMVWSFWLPQGSGHLFHGNLPFLLLSAWPSDVEAIAKLIATFLELHGLESPVELSQSSDSEADGPGSQS